jgi:hypothetical protein
VITFFPSRIIVCENQENNDEHKESKGPVNKGLVFPWHHSLHNEEYTEKIEKYNSYEAQ